MIGWWMKKVIQMTVPVIVKIQTQRDSMRMTTRTQILAAIVTKDYRTILR